MRARILLSPDPVDSSGGSVAPSGPSTEPTAAVPPSNAPPASSAAATVINGTVTEDVLKLRQENEELKKTVKQRETEVSEWQAEAQRLKQPTPVPVKRKPPEEKPFRIGRFV